MTTPDLVVVGGGVTGTATALAAAQRGLRTVLLERFEIGHRHGSSHGSSRIIRLAYHEVEYITLAREAFERWRGLERDIDRPLLRTTGGLDCGMSGTPSLEQTIEAMREADVPVDALSSSDLAARFPQISFDPGMVGVYQPDAAVLYADQCVAALARRARESGAEIRERSLVQRIESAPGSVTIAVNGTTITAGAVVIAAGSWANTLLLCPLRLAVTREQVAYFDAAEHFAAGRFPLVLEHNAEGPPLVATFPRLPPNGWVKLMYHRNGPAIDTENLAGTADQAALTDLTGYAHRRLRGLGRVREVETCRYTMTPDEDFVLDAVPGQPGVWLASACSGHGFKFGPVVGETMVDLLTMGTTTRPTARFAINRPALSALD
jgi:sarcosine oxidase